MKAGSNDRRRRPARVLRRILWPPLRTKLVLAFFALIISSALATIFIGNAIFSRKVDQLARETVALYTKVAEQVIQRRLEAIRSSALHLATRLDAGQGTDTVYEEIYERLPVDFVLRFRNGGFENIAWEVHPDSAGYRIRRFSTVYSGEIHALNLLLSRTGVTKTSAAGLAVFGAGELESLGIAVGGGDILTLLGAAHSGKGTVVVGSVINGHVDVLEEIKRAIDPGDRKLAEVSIFLYDKRVATTIGPGSFGSEAEAAVSRAVLEEGRPFTGRAKVVGLDYYTSYKPLRDLEGVVIGMVGSGTNEEVYTQVRRETTTLFSSLIVAGMIFGFIMSYFFSLWLMRPIASLAQGMSRVAEGDLNYKVRLNSRDELGRLAAAFNKMVKAVKQRDHRLREMTEHRLSAVEKQISIGRLAAGVAHEINNPLTAVLSLSRLMIKRMPPDDPRYEDLDIIVTETTRCREIVRNLLDFARESPVDKKVVDINEIVNNTLSLTTKYDAMERARVDLDLSPSPLYVNADAKMIQQVFTNILLNAAEAMERQGTIRIVTDEDSSGSYVQVQVRDTGKGISRENMQHIFQPFFTTWAGGKGTGLGLSVSLGIIRRHEGSIEVESLEGEGTTVTVLLPRVMG